MNASRQASPTPLHQRHARHTPRERHCCTREGNGLVGNILANYSPSSYRTPSACIRGSACLPTCALCSARQRRRRPPPPPVGSRCSLWILCFVHKLVNAGEARSGALCRRHRASFFTLWCLPTSAASQLRPPAPFRFPDSRGLRMLATSHLTGRLTGRWLTAAARGASSELAGLPEMPRDRTNSSASVQSPALSLLSSPSPSLHRRDSLQPRRLLRRCDDTT